MNQFWLGLLCGVVIGFYLFNPFARHLVNTGIVKFIQWCEKQLKKLDEKQPNS